MSSIQTKSKDNQKNQDLDTINLNTKKSRKIKHALNSATNPDSNNQFRVTKSLNKSTHKPSNNTKPPKKTQPFGATYVNKKSNPQTFVTKQFDNNKSTVS